MGDFGFSELLLIAVVILIFFGGNKIPEFMRALGKGVREFNNAKDNMRMELQNGMKENSQPKQQPTQSQTQVQTSTGNTPPPTNAGVESDN
jgi:sec-independent protein translocase protein TatA